MRKKSNPNKNKLTAKQERFCQYYIQDFNATQSYLKAFNAKYNTAKVEACRLLTDPNIKKEIKRLKKNVNKDIFVESKDIFNLMVKIAFARIDNYLEWGHTIETKLNMFGDPIINKETQEKETYINNYIKVKEHTKVDTSIIQEISSGKDGFKIKLIDRKYALDYLVKFFDLFPDEFKRSLEVEKLKLLMDKKNEYIEEVEIIDDIIETE